jgi:hypothetical protein
MKVKLSTGRYSYTVDMHGRAERWIGEYHGWVANIAAPVPVN